MDLKDRDYGIYQKRMKRICGAALLVLDVFLMHTITDEREVKILFDKLEKSCEIKLSTILCSQWEPASYSAMIINDKVSANAITKRATRHYTVVMKKKSAAEISAAERLRMQAWQPERPFRCSERKIEKIMRI